MHRDFLQKLQLSRTLIQLCFRILFSLSDLHASVCRNIESGQDDKCPLLAES